MEKERMKWIVDSALGYLAEEYRCQEIENLFAGNMPCMHLYSDAIGAYWNLCERLNIESDPDIEVMINAFIDITEIVALKMFESGLNYDEK